MTPDKILTETTLQASEWLEMTDNPAELLAGILAAKLAVSYEEVDYLKRRLAHECCAR